MLTALVVGCATDATTAEKAAKEKDEYVTVVTTGSNIPKRVKKSDIINGTVAIMIIFSATALLIVDLAYPLIDPRIRYN